MKIEALLGACVFVQLKWLKILTHIAGSSIHARHEIIQPAIGVFPEEEAANTLVSLLMWLLPTIVVLEALVDFGLSYLFSTRFHPWAGILSSRAGCRKEKPLMDEDQNKKNATDDQEDDFEGHGDEKMDVKAKVIFS